MSLSQQQMQALDNLSPPESLDRIIRFLSDLGSQGNTPLGESGRSAQAFAASVAGGAHSFSARQTSGWVAILMDRYQIKLGEIQEFAIWFVQRQEILAETNSVVVNDLTERAPEQILARPVPSAVYATQAAATAPAAYSILTASGSRADDRPASPDTPLTLRTTSRRLTSAMSLPLDTDPQDKTPDLPEDRPLRRQAGRGFRNSEGRSFRARRIERGSTESAAETEGPSETEQTPEALPAGPQPFRLKPSMITRRAFVTNVGLGGTLLGLSLAQAEAGAAPLAAAPTMLPTATALPLNLGPTLGPLQPSGSMGIGAPTIAPAFTPMVTPMTPAAPAPPVPGAWLGMPPAPSSPTAAFPSPSLDSQSSAPPMSGQPVRAMQFPSTMPLLPVIPPTDVPVAGVSPELFSMSPMPKAMADPLTPALFGLNAGSAAVTLAERLLPQQPLSGSAAAPTSTGAAPQAEPSHDAGIGARLLAPGAFKFAGTSKTAPTVAARGQAAAGIIAAHLPTATPEMGQITLMAPPLQVASAQAERGGVAASLDWQTLADGAHPLDAGSLARLTQALPEQASVLYPALPPGSLGKGAVNLPLSMPLIQSLLQKGYGNAGAGMASQAADLAAAGGKPAAAPLAAQLIPVRSPIGADSGILGHQDKKTGAGALAEAGQGQATRGGVMDFLGMPIRLAPSLGGRSDLARETAVRNAGQGPVKPQTSLRPEQFTPLRNRLFPAFHSMTVEPDQMAWRKAAPAFGLRDSKLTTLLAPDARVPVQTLTGPQPSSSNLHSAAARPGSLPGMPFPPSLLAAGKSHTAPQRHQSAFGSPSVTGPFAPGTPAAFGAHPTARGLHSLAHQGQGNGTAGGGTASFLSHLPLTQRHLGGSATHGVPAHVSQSPVFSRSGAQSPGLGHPALSLLHPHLPTAAGHSFSSSAHPVTAWPTASVPHIGASVSGHSSAAPGGSAVSFTPTGGSRAGFSASGGSLASPRFLPGQTGSRKGGSGSESSPGFTPLRPGGASFSRSEPHQLSSGTSHIGTSSVLPGSHSSAAPAPLSLRHPASTLAVPPHKVSPVFLPDSRLISPRAGTETMLASRPASLRPATGKVTGPGVVGSIAGTVPAMRFATPRAHRRHAGDAAQPLTIQRAETITTTTPTRNDGSRPGPSAKPEPENSVAASEINALAGEVWSLLKRRLANEAERRGRW